MRPVPISTGKRSDPISTGSTFWFTAALGIDEDAAGSPVPPEVTRTRVLAVSENEDERELLGQHLTAWGFTCDVHATFDAARESLERGAKTWGLAVVADGDALDSAGPIDQHAQPSPRRRRQRGHLTGELLAHDRVRCDPAFVKPLQSFALGRS